MNHKLMLLTCALGLSGFIGAQACSSDSTSGGAAGEAGALGDAGDGPTAGSGGSTAGTGGDAGATASEAGQGGEAPVTGEGGAGGEAELTQAELCDQFCTGEFVTCTGDLQQYTDEATCLTACNGYARGKVGDTTGNTLDCRIYHLNAAMAAADTHCPHTSATPTAFCVD